MKALERAKIQTPGLRSTAFWIRPASSLEIFSDSFCVLSPARTSIDGSPLLSGVSCSQNRIKSTPIAPAIAAPKNPHCHPAAPTNRLTKTNDNPSPKLWDALKNP